MINTNRRSDESFDDYWERKMEEADRWIDEQKDRALEEAYERTRAQRRQIESRDE